MTIKRNGIEIELTRAELAEAYFEAEHTWDTEYISGSLLEQYEDGDDVFEGMADRLRNDEAFRSRVAFRYRKYLENTYGSDTEWECLKDAYTYIDEVYKMEA